VRVRADREDVEVREGDGLLEPVGDLSAVAAEGEGELAEVGEQVRDDVALGVGLLSQLLELRRGGIGLVDRLGQQRVLYLRERPYEWQEGLCPTRALDRSSRSAPRRSSCVRATASILYPVYAISRPISLFLSKLRPFIFFHSSLEMPAPPSDSLSV
jgi:hypothetical protein